MLYIKYRIRSRTRVEFETNSLNAPTTLKYFKPQILIPRGTVLSRLNVGISRFQSKSSGIRCIHGKFLQITYFSNLLSKIMQITSPLFFLLIQCCSGVYTGSRDRSKWTVAEITMTYLLRCFPFNLMGNIINIVSTVFLTCLDKLVKISL